MTFTIDTNNPVPSSSASLRHAQRTADLEAAETVWVWNRTHPEELRTELQKLRGSLSSSAFGGIDGVTYQRRVRGEWDERERL